MIRGVGAQIAFPTFELVAIRVVGGKKGPAWSEGASSETEAAANAFLFVHYPHMAVLGICCQRTCGTYLHTGGIDALAALLDRQIIGEGGEGILYDLDSGERQALHTFVDQGTGQHAAQTSLAFGNIHQEISVGRWN
jgi:hypothetical protein